MRNDNLIIYVVCYFVGTLISIYIIRAVFDIPKILRHLTAQTKLLTYLAEKAGVDKDTAREIFFAAQGEKYIPEKNEK
jgi:hypothetical protein